MTTETGSNREHLPWRDNLVVVTLATIVAGFWPMKPSLGIYRLGWIR